MSSGLALEGILGNSAETQMGAASAAVHPRREQNLKSPRQRRIQIAIEGDTQASDKAESVRS